VPDIAIWNDEWCRISLQERRQKYNNVFDNYCTEKAEKKRK
jgi:hypothetical protein